MAFSDPSILPSDITPKAVFENRRNLIKAAAAGSFGMALVPWFSRQALAANPEKLLAVPNPAYTTKEELTPYKYVTGYNNFYEFGTDKEFNHKYCTAFYDKEFAKYKDEPIRLLEIGVHRGGGLAVFNEYFSDADIYGVDPYDFGAKRNCEQWPRIKVIYENAYTKEFASKLPG